MGVNIYPYLFIFLGLGMTPGRQDGGLPGILQSLFIFLGLGMTPGRQDRGLPGILQSLRR